MKNIIDIVNDPEIAEFLPGGRMDHLCYFCDPKRRRIVNDHEYYHTKTLGYIPCCVYCAENMEEEKQGISQVLIKYLNQGKFTKDVYQYSKGRFWNKCYGCHTEIEILTTKRLYIPPGTNENIEFYGGSVGMCNNCINTLKLWSREDQIKHLKHRYKLTSNLSLHCKNCHEEYIIDSVELGHREERDKNAHRICEKCFEEIHGVRVSRFAINEDEVIDLSLLAIPLDTYLMNENMQKEVEAVIKQTIIKIASVEDTNLRIVIKKTNDNLFFYEIEQQGAYFMLDPKWAIIKDSLDEEQGIFKEVYDATAQAYKHAVQIWTEHKSKNNRRGIVVPIL